MGWIEIVGQYMHVGVHYVTRERDIRCWGMGANIATMKTEEQELCTLIMRVLCKKSMRLP